MAVYHINYEKVSNQILQMNKIVKELQQKQEQVIALKETLIRSWEGPASLQTMFQLNRLIEEFDFSIRQMDHLCSTVDQIAKRMLEEDRRQALQVNSGIQ